MKKEILTAALFSSLMMGAEAMADHHDGEKSDKAKMEKEGCEGKDSCEGKNGCGDKNGCGEKEKKKDKEGSCGGPGGCG